MVENAPETDIVQQTNWVKRLGREVWRRKDAKPAEAGLPEPLKYPENDSFQQAAVIVMEDLNLSSRLGLADDKERLFFHGRLSSHMARYASERSSYHSAQGRETTIATDTREAWKKKFVPLTSDPRTSAEQQQLTREIDSSAESVARLLFLPPTHPNYRSILIDHLKGATKDLRNNQDRQTPQGVLASDGGETFEAVLRTHRDLISSRRK